MRNVNAAVSDPNSFTTCPGNAFHEILSPVVSADGTIHLEVSDKIDIQKSIDSYRDSTDMAFILRKLGVGDNSVLNNGKTPMYADFSKMPTNPAEFLQMAIDAEKAFYELPLDLRQQFGNDYRQWFADFGSEHFNNAMLSFYGKNESAAFRSQTADIASEVKSDAGE